MPKILITGGGGYVAQRLCHGLSSVHEITIQSRHQLNLTDSHAVSEQLTRQRYDVVIHAAAVGGSRLKTEDSTITDTNLRMYYNLLENKGKFGKLITFGSGAEIFMPETPYGLSKRIIAQSIRETDNFHNLRIFAVFDEHELPTRFIKASILRYMNREDIQIHSNRIMDFYYMQDLITLVEHFIAGSNLPKEVNCSYEEKHTLLGITNMINQLDEHSVPIEVMDNDKLGFYCGQPTKLPIHTVGLREGITRTYNNMIESLNHG